MTAYWTDACAVETGKQADLLLIDGNPLGLCV